MLVTFGKAVDHGVALQGAEDVVEKHTGGNVTPIVTRISPRRYRVRLWADDGRGRGARLAPSGRVTHGADWLTHGLYILALLEAGAVRIEAGPYIYKSTAQFWADAPNIVKINIGSAIAPTYHGDIAVDDEAQVYSAVAARAVLRDAAKRLGLVH